MSNTMFGPVGTNTSSCIKEDLLGRKPAAAYYEIPEKSAVVNYECPEAAQKAVAEPQRAAAKAHTPSFGELCRQLEAQMHANDNREEKEAYARLWNVD